MPFYQASGTELGSDEPFLDAAADLTSAAMLAAVGVFSGLASDLTFTLNGSEANWDDFATCTGIGPGGSTVRFYSAVVAAPVGGAITLAAATGTGNIAIGWVTAKDVQSPALVGGESPVGFISPGVVGYDFGAYMAAGAGNPEVLFDQLLPLPPNLTDVASARIGPVTGFTLDVGVSIAVGDPGGEQDLTWEITGTDYAASTALALSGLSGQGGWHVGRIGMA